MAFSGLFGPFFPWGGDGSGVCATPGQDFWRSCGISAPAWHRNAARWWHQAGCMPGWLLALKQGWGRGFWGMNQNHQIFQVMTPQGLIKSSWLSQGAPKNQTLRLRAFWDGNNAKTQNPRLLSRSWKLSIQLEEKTGFKGHFMNSWTQFLGLYLETGLGRKG